jgi:osmotically-inducible protein OsmY
MTCTPMWQGEPTSYDALVRKLATMALERSAAAHHVDAFVSHGCVILSGTVDSDGTRLDAELAVRNVPGITGVVNCIEVSVPGSR